MPFEGFTCDVTGEPNPTEVCLACAARGALAGCNQTAPVLWGIAENLRPDDFELSVTALLGCPRKRVLKRDYPYYLAPSKSWWALRGTLMHQIIARYSQNDFAVLAEKRFGMALDGVRITGQPDLVDTGRGHLIDFKTTSRLPGPQRRYYCPETGLLIRSRYQRTKYLECDACLAGKHLTKDVEVLVDPQPKPHHVQQLNLYRLLLAKNDVAIHSAEIVYMDMSGQLRLPVELAPVDATEAWVRARLGDAAAGGLPPVLTAADDLWECDYCPVRAVCERLHGAPVTGQAEAA